MIGLFRSCIDGFVGLSLIGYPLLLVLLIWDLPKISSFDDPKLMKRFVIEIIVGILCLGLSVTAFLLRKSPDFTDVIYIMIGLIIILLSLVILPDLKALFERKGKRREIILREEYGQG